MNNFKKLKLYMQIFITALITLSLLFVTSLVTYSQTEKNFRQKSEQYTQEVISHLKQTIYSNYHSLSEIIQFIAFDVDIQNFLLEDKEPAKFQYYQSAISSLINPQ